MLVPETSMNKDRGVILWKHKIRAPWKILTVQSKAIASFVKETTNCYFRFGVSPFDARHDLATLLPSENIRHDYLLFRDRNISNTQSATLAASKGGTAFPICFAISIFDPVKLKSSGKD